MIVAKIISGGQTGADRGGLDAAIMLGLEHGGTCPRGRLAEDGVVPDRYRLVESTSDKYPPRTAANVADSDATLVFSHDDLFDRGTGLTLKLIEQMKKPYVRMSLRPGLDPYQMQGLYDWLRELSGRLGRPLTINIAGPRESRVPGLQEHVERFLTAVILSLQESEMP